MLRRYSTTSVNDLVEITLITLTVATSVMAVFLVLCWLVGISTETLFEIPLSGSAYHLSTFQSRQEISDERKPRNTTSILYRSAWSLLASADLGECIYRRTTLWKLNQRIYDSCDVIVCDLLYSDSFDKNATSMLQMRVYCDRLI